MLLTNNTTLIKDKKYRTYFHWHAPLLLLFIRAAFTTLNLKASQRHFPCRIVQLSVYRLWNPLLDEFFKHSHVADQVLHVEFLHKSLAASLEPFVSAVAFRTAAYFTAFGRVAKLMCH